MLNIMPRLGKESFVSRLSATCLALLLAGSAAATTARADDEPSPADKAFVGAMHDMMMGMHNTMPTGDTDLDFARMMIPHHQAAVDMAKAELQYGKDPALRALAQSIVADQEKEIAMMKGWQDKHAAH